MEMNMAKNQATNTMVGYEDYDYEKLSEEIKKKLEMSLLGIEVFQKKSEEREKQLLLRLEELENQLKDRESKIETEKKKLRKLKRMKEKEALDQKLSELKLKCEIETMRSDMEIIKRKGVFEDMEGKKQDMETILQQLKEKEEQLSDTEATNSVLTIRERELSEELQDVRKELINKLIEETSYDIIGVKMMGELDSNPFINSMKGKSSGIYYIEGMKLCSLWESYIADPSFYPFKIITDEQGNSKEILDLENQKLKYLKEEHGDEVFFAVSRSLQEINEYNPSGRYVAPELWNFDENRKATLKEVVSHLLMRVKSPNNKKRRRSVSRTGEKENETNKIIEKKMESDDNDLKRMEEKMKEMEELIHALTVKLEEELRDAREVITSMAQNNHMKEDIRKMKRKTFDVVEMDKRKLQLEAKEKELKKHEKKLKLQEDRIEAERIEVRTQRRMKLGEGTTRDIFGVKVIGELDRKPFLEAMKRKLPGEEAEKEAIMLWSCTCLRKFIKDPTWHPFKIIVDMEGNFKEILPDVENESTLKFLKNEYGEEVCKAVTEALLEMNEYPRGRHIV